MGPNALDRIPCIGRCGIFDMLSDETEADTAWRLAHEMEPIRPHYVVVALSNARIALSVAENLQTILSTKYPSHRPTVIGIQAPTSVHSLQ